MKHAITRALTIRDCSQAPYNDAVTFMLIIAGAEVWSNFFNGQYKICKYSITESKV